MKKPRKPKTRPDDAAAVADLLDEAFSHCRDIEMITLLLGNSDPVCWEKRTISHASDFIFNKVEALKALLARVGKEE